MNKLLRAGFLRLRKNNFFWLFMAFSVGLALFMIDTRYSDMKNYGDVIEAEQLMLNYATIAGIAIAIFTSLFLGAEYSDGAIRNKISIGHKRSAIYLCNLLITSVTSLFAYLIFLAVVAVIGIPLFGSITISISELFMLLGCIFVTVIAYSGLFTFVAMMISSKSVNAVVSIMLAFGLMMAAMTCFNIAEAPEFIEIETVEDGEMKTEELPNPKYPSEGKKKVCRTLLDINPAGQMYQLAGRMNPDLRVLPLYSLGEFIIFAGVGIFLFDKKDLK